ncbi:MAG: hypothetical protein GF334_08335 [Candidatus Altiarchaeales archaeon]|nr:hypothetical protein [Candidatus Altiarchaeales archaeon]
MKKRKPSEDQREFRFMQQEFTPKPHPTSFTKQDAIELTQQVDRRFLVGSGRISLADKAERLFDYTPKEHESRILGELKASAKSEAEYAAVLQTLDYAALRDRIKGEHNMPEVLKALRKSRGEGLLPTEHMRALTSAGEVYDETTRKPAESVREKIKRKKDWLEGGSGYGASVRIASDLHIPALKANLVEALEEMGIEKITVKGGSSRSPRYTPKKQLQAVYAKEIRRRRAVDRRREDLLDHI